MDHKKGPLENGTTFMSKAEELKEWSPSNGGADLIVVWEVCCAGTFVDGVGDKSNMVEESKENSGTETVKCLISKTSYQLHQCQNKSLNSQYQIQQGWYSQYKTTDAEI